MHINANQTCFLINVEMINRETRKIEQWDEKENEASELKTNLMYL